MEIIDTSWYGATKDGQKVIAELETRKDFEEFCLDNGAVGGCAKNKTAVRQSKKAKLKEWTKWICDNYKPHLDYE